MRTNDREVLKKLINEPELLADTSFQRLVIMLMNQLDQGELQIVSVFDGKAQIDDDLIELLSLSIALRRHLPKRFPQEKKYSTLDTSIRRLPRSFIRFGAYISHGVVLMPFSLVNMGAYVGEKSMIDTGARIGSGAYIGESVHISGGVGIGGVLEPKGTKPVIIENSCFIGANSTISEGVHIGENTIIGAGSTITGSIRVYDSRGGNPIEMKKKGFIPANVVAIPSSYLADSGLYRPCMEIIRDRTGDEEGIINQDLR